MSNNFTTLLKRKADEPTSSPEKVTAEQQARMEQNRKLALERLKQRKLAIESSPSASTPASTSTSLVPSTSTTSCTNVRSSTEIMKSPVKKGRTRHPLEYKLSLLSSRCKSWHYLFRFGCEFGLNVLQFLDLASCCLARSVSSSFRELAMKVEHQRIDFFSLTRKRPKKRGKVTGEVLGRILSYPGCQEVKRLSIKGCVKITGEDLRNVLKSPACKLARLVEFDHTVLFLSLYHTHSLLLFLLLLLFFFFSSSSSSPSFSPFLIFLASFVSRAAMSLCRAFLSSPTGQMAR